MDKDIKEYAKYLIEMYRSVGGTKNSSIYKRLVDKKLDIFKVTELACEVEVIYQRDKNLSLLLK